MDRHSIEGIRYISKYVAEVQISDTDDVTTRVEDRGDVYSNGGIYVSCPELGFEGDNLIYCRYALATPYYKVKDGDKVWIEPTIGATERWIYSGFVDCGRASVDPTSGKNTQGIIENEDGVFKFLMGDDLDITVDSTAKTIIITLGNTVVTLDGSTGTEKITLKAGIAETIQDASGGGKTTINGTALEVTV